MIDIPIGLRDAGREPRLCDTRARQLLGSPRCNSVFPVPLRPALRAPDRAQADLLNRAASGAGIACQTFAISDKIAKVDAFLLAARQPCHPPIRECHPELCFWALNGGQSGACALTADWCRLLRLARRHGAADPHSTAAAAARPWLAWAGGAGSSSG